MAKLTKIENLGTRLETEATREIVGLVNEFMVKEQGVVRNHLGKYLALSQGNSRLVSTNPFWQEAWRELIKDRGEAIYWQLVSKDYRFQLSIETTLTTLNSAQGDWILAGATDRISGQRLGYRVNKRGEVVPIQEKAISVGMFWEIMRESSEKGWFMHGVSREGKPDPVRLLTDEETEMMGQMMRDVEGYTIHQGPVELLPQTQAVVERRKEGRVLVVTDRKNTLFRYYLLSVQRHTNEGGMVTMEEIEPENKRVQVGFIYPGLLLHTYSQVFTSS